MTQIFMYDIYLIKRIYDLLYITFLLKNIYIESKV